MAGRIAVEDGLRPVRECLRAAGFDVVSTAGGIPENVQAIVLNGLDDNFLGRQNVVRRVPIVNADGMTPEQVADEVHRRLQNLQTARRV